MYVQRKRRKERRKKRTSSEEIEMKKEGEEGEENDGKKSSLRAHIEDVQFMTTACQGNLHTRCL
jgi:hypothetical protein